MFNSQYSRRIDQSKQVLTARLGLHHDASGILGLRGPILGTEESSFGKEMPGEGEGVA